ncbi:MAG: hypothetical protein AAGH83_06890 [Pseudomonadota bacterium]
MLSDIRKVVVHSPARLTQDLLGGAALCVTVMSLLHLPLLL